MEKRTPMSGFRLLFLLLTLAAGIAAMDGRAGAQEIMLDKMEKCGDLICYPCLDDPDRFYYLPDQPRLAYKNGRPQFSFLKYARTQATGEAGTGSARGGGIVHFLVTYGASDTRVREAENELQENHPDASLAGPIAYRNGSFALITSFKEGNEQTTRAVAVGKAPLMEGQKAAVSMALTREGAELLWESFHTDTPDISLVFDMEFAGIREPYEATLEADWKQISKHDRIKAGFKYKWFGADVNILLQELRQTGAVKITTKGENENMDQILQSANEKLLKVMFDPAPAANLKKAAPKKSSYDSLNQAVELLKNAAGTKKSKKNASASALRPFWQSVYQQLLPSAHAETFENPTDSTSLDSITAAPDDPSAGHGVLEEAALIQDPGYAYTQARRLYEKARKGGFREDDIRAALKAYEAYQENHQPTGSRADEVKGRIRMLRQRLGKTADAASSGALDAESTAEAASEQLPDKPGAASAEKASKKSVSTASGKKPAAEGKDKTKRKKEGKAKKTAAQKARASGAPGFSLVASYEMKRIKRSGKLVYHMNHYRTETQAFAMAENIGPIYARYGHDPRVFRAVTIDDPVFKQREILVTLDGQDAATFTKYMNFVTVKMKKRHQAGEMTTGEVVITPESFSDSGNNFSMTYGWKDDRDRSAWLDYQYQAIWSFHGGVQIRKPWQTTDSPMLALAPPHRYRPVSIEGDGSRLSNADVRHGVITLKCRIGDHYVTRQATIKNTGPAPALLLDIPEDPENPETRISITWYLTGNRQVSSEERRLKGDIIYWDELPGGGV